MLKSEMALTVFLLLLPVFSLGILFLSIRYYRKRSERQLTSKEPEIEKAYNAS